MKAEASTARAMLVPTLCRSVCLLSFALFCIVSFLMFGYRRIHCLIPSMLMLHSLIGCRIFQYLNLQTATIAFNNILVVQKEDNTIKAFNG